MHSSINGTKVHTLANKSTSTTVKANSTDSNGNVISSKQRFSVSIKKSAFTKYAVGFSATKSFGTVASGKYKVNLIKNTGTIYNRAVGSGTIKQK